MNRIKNPGDYGEFRVDLLKQTIFVMVDEEGFVAMKKKFKADIESLPEDSVGSAVGPITNKYGPSFLLFIDVMKLGNGADVVSTAVHECVHMKQLLMDWIGESSPSREFEAYLTQSLFDQTCQVIYRLVEVDIKENESGK